MYQRSTLRRMSPVQREIAERINAVELAEAQRLKRLVEKVGPIEADAKPYDSPAVQRHPSGPAKTAVPSLPPAKRQQGRS